MHPNETLELEIGAIGVLSREDLADRWVRAHGCPPPKGVKRALLERSAAWQLQSKRLGGLSADTRRLMRRLHAAKSAALAGEIVSGAGADNVQSHNRGNHADQQTAILSRKQLDPGTRLVREWNGRTHVIEVIENGFIHDGKTYRSLSAIARRITGTRWSGPRFFGQ
ncbi:DUF2924 domain-containing protein [Hoeflea sp. AS60]|uniref:DUF2924 domain-containing protein n=1 Tax=Hoeflea sp. AS60 TaxID=3135780 RepID=UPI0031700336